MRRYMGRNEEMGELRTSGYEMYTEQNELQVDSSHTRLRKMMNFQMMPFQMMSACLLFSYPLSSNAASLPILCYK